MEKTLELEKAANLYAGSQLKSLRGEQPRVAFGKRIGMKESNLHSYESGDVRISVSKLATIAKALNVPLSTFILPDDHPAFGDDAEDGADDKDEKEHIA